MRSRRSFLTAVTVGLSSMLLPSLAQARGFRRKRCLPAPCSCRSGTGPCLCPKSIYAVVNGIYYYICWYVDGSGTCPLTNSCDGLLNTYATCPNSCGDPNCIDAQPARFPPMPYAGCFGRLGGGCKGELSPSKVLASTNGLLNYFDKKNIVTTPGTLLSVPSKDLHYTIDGADRYFSLMQLSRDGCFVNMGQEIATSNNFQDPDGGTSITKHAAYWHTVTVGGTDYHVLLKK